MRRREFIAACSVGAATAATAERAVSLEAVAAPRLPERRRVPASLARAEFVELRSYADARTALAVKRMLGSRAHNPGEATLLVPFESLAARAQFWREFSCRPEWRELCGQRDTSYQFSIFRGVAG